MNHAARIARVQRRLDELEVDALLITAGTNVRYLTGFSGTNGQVLVTRDEAVFFSDGRYAARAASLVQGAEISIYSARLADRLVPHLKDEGIARLGFEATTVTVAGLKEFSEQFPTEMVATTGVVEQLRRRKDDDEIDRIREAIRIGDEAFAWVIDHLAPGRSETEIALALEVTMRETGADAVSFDPIVGSGELSAHIHHTPSDRRFEKGDLVLLDFGCRLDGYCSDLTRTVVLGPATEEQAAIYELVLEAQRTGIDAIAAGSSGRDVDAAARAVIEARGHGDDFGHGLGHGVGLDIHEAPKLATISTDELIERDVVTVEPGVYVRDRGGVRIEDCVLVTSSGAEVLGNAPKDRLIEL